MRFDSISPKQAEIFKFMAEPYGALICDGAVRSGKTMMMIVAFVEWAMARFDGASFGVCGKTVRSAERNIIAPFQSIGSVRQKYRIAYSRSTSLMTVRHGNKTNYFYVFGGKDESSYMLIQGITLAGVFFDEVALMPQSFVEQAIARTLSVDDAKLWFNCNPENPNHWFYREWILKPAAHNARHLHFLMSDNPSLSAKALARAKASFSGVFYDRAVRGLWVVAEGIIYPMFDKERHVTAKIPRLKSIGFAADVGHSNATAVLALGEGVDNRLYVLDEYYHSGKKTGVTKSPAAYAKDYIKFRERVRGEFPDVGRGILFIDPSALGFKAQLAEEGETYVRDAQNDVVPGIQTVASLIDNDLLRVHPRCKNLLDELGTYAWDDKAAKRGEDSPVKQDDHAVDCLRYYVFSQRRLWHGRRGADA